MKEQQSSTLVEIRKMIDKWVVDYIYIDSAAQQTRFDFAQNYDITTINAKKSVLDGIGYVAGVVDNDKLTVDQRCKEALWALDQYQWDPNLIYLRKNQNITQHLTWLMPFVMLLYSFEVMLQLSSLLLEKIVLDNR